MTRYCCWGLLLGCLLLPGRAAGQSLIINNPYYTVGPVIGPGGIYGGGITYSRHRGNSLLTASIGGLTFAPAFGYGVLAPGYVASGFNSITVITPPVVVPPPVVIAPQVAARPNGILNDDLARDILPRSFIDGRPGPPPTPDLPPRQMPGRDAGHFRPLEPDNRDKAARPVPPPPPPKPEPPEPEKKRDLPLPPLPEPDPLAEAARQVALGKTAFANMELGRAVQRFRKATELNPNHPQAWFLLAQAQLGLGKYLDALDAIRSGMALRPDWPRENFRPLELYGPHVAEYPEHLHRLEDTLTRNPNDTSLLFLYAYQLWFDGRKDEARIRFERLRNGPDRNLVERFLRAAPGNAIVRL
jgi:hypothetical protein